MTLTIPVACAFTWDVWRTVDDRNVAGGGAVVGGLLLIVTGLVVLTVVAWYQPIVRAMHRWHPRSTRWPP